MALRGIVNLDRDGQSFALMNRRTARKERRRVRILAKSEQHQLEARKLTTRETEVTAQFVLVSECRFFGRLLAQHPMDLRGLQRELREQRPHRHRVVAGGVVGRHAAFVAPEKLHLFPVDTEVELSPEQVVNRGGSGAAREAE